MGVTSLGLVGVLRHLHKGANTHQIAHFKVVSSVVCDVYLNKKRKGDQHFAETRCRYIYHQFQEGLSARLPSEGFFF